MPSRKYEPVMKSPSDLAAKLTRQWQNANSREQRLLNADAWPISLSIGRPSSDAVEHHLDRVRAHLQSWRRVGIGEVQWQAVNYRGTAAAIDIPVTWVLHKPSQWVAATGSSETKNEFRRLEGLVVAAEPIFHSLLIRQRHLLNSRSDQEIVQALQLALMLEPGCAQGVPLRALGWGGVDSKFYERNRQLLVKLLDIRHAGLASELGLEAFLDAAEENDHWLLVVDLSGSRLPYRQMRLRDSELQRTALPAANLLIVENERCVHQLPTHPGCDTVAILGAGLNLAWMNGSWLQSKCIAYWGDLDTWGLTMLARARQYQPHLSPLLMNRETFDQYHINRAVPEPVSANTPPQTLSNSEKQFFEYLQTLEKGRLEQEYLPTTCVVEAVEQWLQRDPRSESEGSTLDP